MILSCLDGKLLGLKLEYICSWVCFWGLSALKNNRGRFNQKIKKKADRVISKIEVGGVI